MKRQVQPIHRLSRHPGDVPCAQFLAAARKCWEVPAPASGRGDQALSLQVRWRQKGPLGRFLSAPLSKGDPRAPIRPLLEVPQDPHPPNLPFSGPPHTIHTGYPFWTPVPIRRAPGPRACDVGCPASPPKHAESGPAQVLQSLRPAGSSPGARPVPVPRSRYLKNSRPVRRRRKRGRPGARLRAEQRRDSPSRWL